MAKFRKSVERNEVGVKLEVVKRPEARRGFVRLPRRWIIERSFRMDNALSSLDTGLRALSHHASGFAPGGFRHTLRAARRRLAHPKSLTASSQELLFVS
jgi:hypothetical protein